MFLEDVKRAAKLFIAQRIKSHAIPFVTVMSLVSASSRSMRSDRQAPRVLFINQFKNASGKTLRPSRIRTSNGWRRNCVGAHPHPRVPACPTMRDGQVRAKISKTTSWIARLRRGRNGRRRSGRNGRSRRRSVRGRPVLVVGQKTSSWLSLLSECEQS
jgi:hypothetical protein